MTMPSGLHELGYRPKPHERRRHGSGVCSRAAWRRVYRRARLLRSHRAPPDGTRLTDWHFGCEAMAAAGLEVA